MSLVVILALREGSGTDLVFQVERVAYLVSGILQGGLVGVLVIGVARWLGNRSQRPARRFLILAMALPVFLFLALAFSSLAVSGVHGLPLLDPRRWLEAPAFALTFYAAGLAYLAIARAKVSRNHQ
ncbi:hypothetical protein U0030_06340 [Brevundimonas bullata]|uniref:hypothetical protein n=1 Tax=Brevundimonas bullata TaxID=13160 RepID=UPI0013B46E78|nr:hypothetical protein [Brevundimonas bullata]WQE38082.1 hypothetical protein U0030_06340 [Brevundimonas bullata]